MADRTIAELHLAALPSLVPLVSAAALEGARALGFKEEDAGALGVATEEVFSHLALSGAPGREVVIRILGSRWRAEVEIRFTPEHVDFRPFNLTFRTTPDDDPLLSRTALAIASQVVDRFRISRRAEQILLSLTKERSFPKAAPPPPEPRPEGPVSARAAQPHEFPLAAGLAAARYPAEQWPRAFESPEKVAGMAAAGDLGAVVAADAVGRLAGALFWLPAGARMAGLFGPFLFQDPPVEGVASLLLDAVVGSLARTGLEGLIARSPTSALPSRAMEPLGTFEVPLADGTARTVEARYRQLDEDPGGVAHVHPSVEAFVRDSFRQLSFGRVVRVVPGSPPSGDGGTAFATEVDRVAGQARLTPLWLGSDAREMLRGLVDALAADSFRRPLAELDLGEPSHAGFAPALLEAGFVPRLILPWAGNGDVLLFQLAAETGRR